MLVGLAYYLSDVCLWCVLYRSLEKIVDSQLGYLQLCRYIAGEENLNHAYAAILAYPKHNNNKPFHFQDVLRVHCISL